MFAVLQRAFERARAYVVHTHLAVTSGHFRQIAGDVDGLGSFVACTAKRALGAVGADFNDLHVGSLDFCGVGHSVSMGALNVQFSGWS